MSVDEYKAYLVNYFDTASGEWTHTMRNLYPSLQEAKASPLMEYHNVVISEYLIDYPNPSNVQFICDVLYKHGEDIMERTADGEYSKV